MQFAGYLIDGGAQTVGEGLRRNGETDRRSRAICLSDRAAAEGAAFDQEPIDILGLESGLAGTDEGDGRNRFGFERGEVVMRLC